ncbi:MAG: S41 family peptidase [Bacteroidota bacterium]
MTVRFSLFLFVCSLAFGLRAQTTAPEVVAYLDTFYQSVSTRLLDRDRYDWKQLRATTDSATAGAQTTAEVHDHLHGLLQGLNKHSRLIPPAIMEEWNNRGHAAGNEATKGIPVTTGRRLNERVVYLNMPHIGTGDRSLLTYFADTLQALIAALDSPETDGWILDLRENDGGNCWPMLAGIGPLLGEGVCGYFMQRDGSAAQPWAYRDGASWMGEWEQTRVTGTPYVLQHPSPHIAVLTGPGTMSSGEVTAVAFRGLKNARSFGAATGGYSTTNTNLLLPDGAMVILTVSGFGGRGSGVLWGRGGSGCGGGGCFGGSGGVVVK